MPCEKSRIIWGRAYETGYEITDGRHKSLTCLYNDHLHYLKSGVSIIALRRSFDIIMLELRLHFMEDCSFAEHINFSKLGSFTIDHSEKIYTIEKILCNPADDNLIHKFTPVLESWVNVHLDWGYQLSLEFDPHNALTHVPPYPKVKRPNTRLGKAVDPSHLMFQSDP